MASRSMRLFDMSFASTLDFALPPCPASAPAFALSESAVPMTVESPSEEVFSWELDSGATWLKVTRAAGAYHLSFPGYADVRVSADAKQVVFHRAPGVPWPTLEHLLLDQVIPLALSLAGECVLHCSAVASPVGALVFTGKAGQGKSTLAAAFAVRGCPLLTDDSLLLRPEGQQVTAVPSYPSLRLWPEDTRHFEQLGAEISDVAHYTSKKRLRIDSSRGRFSDRPVNTAALYILADPPASVGAGTSSSPVCRANSEPGTRRSPRLPEPVKIERLSPRDAFVELLQNSIHLDKTGKASLKAQSEKLAVLATAIPAFRLSYPRDHALLPKVVAAILKHAASDFEL